MSKEKNMRKETEKRIRREAKKEEAKRQARKRRVNRIAKRLAIIMIISIVVLGFIYYEFKPVEPLPVAKRTYSLPINDTDFFDGKAIGPRSPTTLYKGYKIGFCCYKSLGLWETLTESRKDKYVWPYVKQPK